MSLRRRHTFRLLPCLTALVLAVPAPARAGNEPLPMLTIGHSLDCDFVTGSGMNPLQQAANAAGSTATEIRMQRGPIGNQPVLLTNQSLTIRGGYASCADARAGTAVAPDARSILQVEPTLGTRPLTISASGTAARTVALHHLSLEDPRGLRPNIPQVGGGLAAVGPIDLLIADSDFIALDARQYGGAIAIAGGVTLHLRNTRLSHNLSDGDAGAIHCSLSHLHIDATTRLLSNRARGVYPGSHGDGGAIMALRCRMTLHARAHPDTPSAALPGGLADNEARRHGGAIHAVHSTVQLLGGRFCPDLGPCPNLPVLLRGNRADSDRRDGGNGGALALFDSALFAKQFVMADNHADNGGAIAAHRDPEANPQSIFLGETANERALARECWRPEHCNWLNGNVAHGTATHNLTVHGRGGALFVDGQAARLTRVRAERNSALYGTLAQVQDLHGALDLQHSVITGNQRDDLPNQDWILVSVATLSRLRVEHSTVVEPAVRAFLFNFDASSSGRFIGNIIHAPDATGLLGGVNGFFEGYCNVTSAAMALIEAPLRVVDFGFIDSANGDLRLGHDSPARDACDRTGPGAEFDIAWQRRGVALEPDAAPFDIGAYETLDGERLFADGFWRPAN